MAEALEVDAGSIRRESLLVADLGATLIDLLDLHYRIEKKFDVYLSKVASFWEPTNAPGRITAGMVVDCVVDTIRSRFKGPPETTKYDDSGRGIAWNTRSSLSDLTAKRHDAGHTMKHVLRCPHCWEAAEYFANIGPCRVKCPTCRRRFISLGLLPLPQWQDMVMESIVEGPHTLTPKAMEVTEIPKWVCPWCGRNLGIKRREKCDRCLCDPTAYGAVSLRDRVDGLPPTTIGAYAELATAPMTGAAALYLLGRATLEQADLRSKARSGPPPPEVPSSLWWWPW